MTDLLESVAKAIGGLDFFNINTWKNVFGVFDTVFDAIHLKVDVALAHLQDLPTTLQDHVITPITSALSDVTDLITPIVSSITDTFEDSIVDPIKDSFQEYVIDPIESIIMGFINEVREML